MALTSCIPGKSTIYARELWMKTNKAVIMQVKPGIQSAGETKVLDNKTIILKWERGAT